MINACHLDRRNQVGDAQLATSEFDVACHRQQFSRVMFDVGRFDEYLAVEDAEHPLRPSLGAIDGDDAKVRGADLLDALLNEPCGFSDVA